MAREIKMRIRSLDASENQTVKVEGVATRRYEDEEVTFLLQAKEARGLYIGQALMVTVAAEDDTEAIPPVRDFSAPRSSHPTVIKLYNVWRTPANTEQDPVNLHINSMNAVRENWPELGVAIDLVCAELDAYKLD
jgi:hypothetical protein